MFHGRLRTPTGGWRTGGIVEESSCRQGPQTPAPVGLLRGPTGGYALGPSAALPPLDDGPVR